MWRDIALIAKYIIFAVVLYLYMFHGVGITYFYIDAIITTIITFWYMIWDIRQIDKKYNKYEINRRS